MPSIKEKIEMARKNEYPNLIAKMPSGWVVMHDDQPLAGYCVLIADPAVGSLNELNFEQRAVYCQDMVAVGDALLKVTKAYRINYETWCNLDQNLHTHIVPRYKDESDEKRVLPACKAYDFSKTSKFNYEKDQAFIKAMAEELAARLK